MAGPERGPLVVPVTELVRHPGSHKHVTTTVEAEGLVMPDARVPDGADLTVDVELEALSDGVVVHGLVTAPWEATCRRCLGPAGGTVRADVEELYQVKPTSEDAFVFDGDAVDLAPLVRENVLVGLPLAPLCRDDCAGLCPSCGADRNTNPCDCATELRDPRWAALEGLREQLDPPMP